MAKDDKKQYRCAFCGKTQDQVRKLILGVGDTGICDECIGRCNEIIAEDLPYNEENKALTISGTGKVDPYGGGISPDWAQKKIRKIVL